MMTKTTKRTRTSGWLKTILSGAVCTLVVPLIWVTINYRPGVTDGNPLVDVSQETTRIIEPLNENGDVDFLEVINLRASKDVTPENNAAVLYVRALGNVGYEPESLFEKFLSRMELDKSSIMDTPFIEFGTWRKEEHERLSIDQLSLDSNSPENLQAQYDYLVSSYAPWSPEQFPSIARWLEDNRECMNIVRAATKREFCYFPLVSNSKPELMGALLPGATKMRELARYFLVSASLHLHEGEIDLFLEDLRCIKRMSEHLASCPTLVERLMSSALARVVLSQAEKACLSNLKSGDLKKVIEFVASLQFRNDLASRIDQCERLVVLDAMVSMGRGEGPNGASVIFQFTDWNEALRFINAEFDRIVEVCEIEDSVQFRQQAEEAEDRLRKFEDEVGSESVGATLGGRTAKGKWIGKLMTAQMMPAFRAIGNVDAAVRSEQEMLLIALAVSAFRADQGRLPENLQQLVPEYLATIPIETYTNEPFKFFRIEAKPGFRIHSTEWLESELGAERTMSVQPTIESFEEYLQFR